jgi:predicted aspartyl protease
MRIPALLLAAGLVSNPAYAALGLEPTPFRLRGEHDVIVPVMLDGQGPYRFLLDTGSSRSAITRRLADTLRLAEMGQTRMVTPSGRRLLPLAWIGRLEVGSAQAHGVQAMVVPEGDLGARGDVDGLVGLDVLGRFAFTIDYKRRHIRWDGGDAGTVAAGVRLPLSSDGGRLVVTLSQPDGLPLRLVPDSGAEALVLFSSPDRRAPRMTPLDAVGLRTLSGLRMVRRVAVDAIDVGDVQLRNQAALLVDSGEAGTLLGDGLLPLHVFEQVSFNPLGGYLIVRGKRG